jgi:hypothetical protein
MGNRVGARLDVASAEVLATAQLFARLSPDNAKAMVGCYLHETGDRFHFEYEWVMGPHPDGRPVYVVVERQPAADDRSIVRITYVEDIWTNA